MYLLLADHTFEGRSLTETYKSYNTKIVGLKTFDR